MITLFKWSVLYPWTSATYPLLAQGKLAFNPNSALCSVGTVVFLLGKTHSLFTGKNALLPCVQYQEKGTEEWDL